MITSATNIPQTRDNADDFFFFGVNEFVNPPSIGLTGPDLCIHCITSFLDSTVLDCF